MSAVAGFIHRNIASRSEIACRAMLRSLAPFGHDGEGLASLGRTVFGYRRHLSLPEDDFDTQPVVGCGGTCLLIADVRIDNREELSASLGITRNCRLMSDATWLMRAWERWGIQCVDHLLGDYAFAVWEENAQRLNLVRSPLGFKTLFFWTDDVMTAFASIPDAIFAIPQITQRFDFDAATAATGGEPSTNGATLFCGIRQVRQGHAVILSASGERDFRHWRLREVAPPRSSGEAGEALRAEMARAVKAQMRRRSVPVATQLSAGRDSSAVTTIAARLLAESNERLLAFTGAPRLGFTDGMDREWLSDESDLAAQTAGLHPNIDHYVCRPAGIRVEDLFSEGHRNNHAPISNASNTGWWLDTMRAARDAGARVLLVGNAGNFTISRGGNDALADYRRTIGFSAWWQLVRTLHAHFNTPWRTIANVSFGPWLPRAVHGSLVNLARRDFGAAIDLPFLRAPYRRGAEEMLTRQLNDRRPPKHYKMYVEQTLYMKETSVTIGVPEFGIDLRDPTADRRVVELCHSFSPDQLISANSQRPAYEAAFADLLPAAVIGGSRRGFQGADWFETFPESQVREAFRVYNKNPVVAEFFDIGEINRLMDHWPTKGGYQMDKILTYGQWVLNSLSTASFISEHFAR